jgi:hypothetical protein
MEQFKIMMVVKAAVVLAVVAKVIMVGAVV